MAAHRQNPTRWSPAFDISTVPDGVLLRESARRLRARQAVAPRAKVLRQCSHCLQAFGARELRRHLPTCPNRKKQAPTRLGWTVRKAVDAIDQDLRAYRYWQSLPLGDRILATWELTEAAYSIKRD